MNVFALTLTWDLDGQIIVTGVLCAVGAALLGNFLVLRKMSMLGDAVAHAVLPGIAAAFLISHSRSSLPMFIGAVVVGILTAMFTEWIRRVGKVDEGASMGVVFTSLFALGLVMLEQAAGHVDLDAGCVLYGAIESTSIDAFYIGDWKFPTASLRLAPVVLINALFVILLFKELKISSFDPAFATTMVFSAKLMHYGLMVLVSVTAVASFEAAGSILVVAMFVVPPAAAYMLTDRLGVMIGISVVIAILSAVFGHVAAVEVPSWFGFGSTTTAGMIAVAGGVMFLLAACLGPQHGVIVKWVRRQVLSLQILSDDIVALLYRREERESGLATRGEIAEELFAGGFFMSLATRTLRRRGELAMEGDAKMTLTDAGRDRARKLVRSHRLWEKYLAEETSTQADRVHGQAERFEHFTDRVLRDELDRSTDASDLDPHGRRIPDEGE